MRRDWLVCGVVVAISGLTYGLTALCVYGRTHSPQLAYFDHLAAAFLAGKPYLAAPPANYDLTLYAGKWYVPFPPLPSLVMLPFVALVGVEGFNTALFSSALGALNVALVYALVRALAHQGWSRAGRADAIWFTALFGFGSAHWLAAATGMVWHVSQVCTVTCLLLAALAALRIRVVRQAALGAGIALGGAMLARPTIVLAWPFIAGILLQRLCDTQAYSRPHTLRVVVLSAWPLVASALVLVSYNVLRFGNPLDFGYLTQNVAPVLRTDLETYGQFNLHYWPRNAWAMLIALPVVNAHGGLPAINPQGLSLLVTMPALVYLVYSVRQWRWPKPGVPSQVLLTSAWLALGLTLGALGSYYNTGGAQFGYRFSLDFLPEVLVLLSCAMPKTPRLMRVLVVLGIVVNAYGVFWFRRFVLA